MRPRQYLKKRGHKWWFQYRVPADVRHLWDGPNPILVTTGTGDLQSAQIKRWDFLAEYHSQFEVLRGNKTYSDYEIEDQARKRFKKMLRNMESKSVSLEDIKAQQEVLEDTYWYDGAVEGEPDPTTRKSTVSDPFPGLGDEEYATLQADLYALAARRAALQGRQPETPETFGRVKYDPVSLRPKSQSKPFSQIAAAYLAERTRDETDGLDDQTVSKNRTIYRLFEEWSNDIGIDDVTPQFASQFLTEISVLTPRWGQSTKNRQLHVSDLLVKCRSDVGLSNKSVNVYASTLGQVWKWAKPRGDCSIDNPFYGIRRGKKKKTGQNGSATLPFTNDELTKVLKERPAVRPNDLSIQQARPWIILIGAFSGMRLNEICTLDIEDIKEEDGVLYFDISAAKSEAGVRVVPVHSVLINSGLMEYAKMIQTGRLFPVFKEAKGKKPSNTFSTRFTNYRRDVGACREMNERGRDKLGFHSFRKNATGRMRSKYETNDVAEIVGHEKIGITDVVYNKDGMTMKARQEIVEAVVYGDQVMKLAGGK